MVHKAANNVAGAVRPGVSNAAVRFYGVMQSVELCRLACERQAYPDCTSFTWHQRDFQKNAGVWAGMCFGRVDGVWQPSAEVGIMSGQITSAGRDHHGDAGWLPMHAAHAPRQDYCSLSHGGFPCQIGLNATSMNDLAGAQLSRRIEGLGLALRHGCNFVYRPLRPSFFGPRFDQKMADAMNERFGIGRGCLRWSTKTSEVPCTNQTKWDLCGTDVGWRQLAQNSQIRGQLAQSPRHDMSLMDVFVQMRRRMRHSRKDSSPLQWYVNTPAHHVHAAVHVRRGDLSTHAHWASGGRWWPDDYYQCMLPRLFATLAGVRFTVHVFSDGDGWAGARREWAAWWRRLAPPSGGLEFHTAEDQLETMVHLADADILVLSPSSFCRTMANYTTSACSPLRITGYSSSLLTASHSGAAPFVTQLCGLVTRRASPAYPLHRPAHA